MDFVGPEFELVGARRTLKVPVQTITVPSVVRVTGDDALLNAAFALGWLGFSQESIGETGYCVTLAEGRPSVPLNLNAKHYVGPDFRWEVSGFWPTVRDELAMGDLRELNPDHARVVDALGITALMDRDPRRLSGGETAKVILAAHLVRHPRFLVIDRVLDELDVTARTRLLGELKGLLPEGVVLAAGQFEETGVDITVSTDSEEARWTAIPQRDVPYRCPREPTVGDLKLEVVRSRDPRPSASMRIEGFKVLRPAEPVFEPISCSLAAGDLVFVMGANGCGKTSFLEGMAGLLKSQGLIDLRTNGQGVPPQQFFALSPQDPRCDITETSVEAELLTASGGRLVPQVLLDELGVSPEVMGSSLCDDIGLQKLISVIAATVRGKPCCLLDEPSLYLTRAFRSVTGRAICRYLNEGGIVFCSSHDGDLIDDLRKGGVKYQSQDSIATRGLRGASDTPTSPGQND